MKIRSVLTCLALAAAAAAPAAHATTGVEPGAVTCDGSFTVFADAYIACLGPVVGTSAPASVFFSGFGSFTLVGLSGDNTGAFAADPGPSPFGTLALGTALSGPFVIGLQGSYSTSLYLFNGHGGAISGLDFDTFGVADSHGFAGPDLAHAVLYTASPVPEPRSLVLMLAGLGAVGFLAGRRRRAL